MKKIKLLTLYRAMLTARRIDRTEQELTNRGEATFHVAGTGHEGTVALIPHLIEDDWLYFHYRDKAMMLARGLSVRTFFDNLFYKDNSSSRGRRMNAFMSDPRLNILSMPALIGNNAIQAVGIAAAIKDRVSRPLVYCSVGDGGTQQGEFLEACAEAARNELPVLFFVQDNGWAISTRTKGKTLYSLPGGAADSFHGMPIHHVDGRDVIDAHRQLGPIIEAIRQNRRPAMVVFQVERLSSHTNADDQTVYRCEQDIRRAMESSDPLRIFERRLLEQGYSRQTLQQVADEVNELVVAAEADSAAGPNPTPLLTAKRPVSVELTHPSREQSGNGSQPQLVMRQAINAVLRRHLRQSKRVTLYGEDIEDPKGDVFGVTKGLSTDFPDQVKNSPLAEATIVGTAIGRALAGERPVAFLQFADFLPIAQNQIVSELASMYWRTDGQWNVPAILMVACGGYRPGLGPFHAQTLEASMAQTPGLDIFMPSTAADAAGLLNAAFASGRPTIFFYPKAKLNDPRHTTSDDIERQFVPIGPARKARLGRDITLVGWGNTVDLCQQAADSLETVGIETEVLDLRTLAPWDEHAVLASAEKTARLIVVHEDSHTCGLGSEILATVAEKTRVPVAMRRVTRPDTFIPCNFSNQLDVLPSFKRILTTAAELLDLELSWIESKPASDGLAVVEAIGSGPADETVEVVELFVKPGDTIQRGDDLASLEATKSVFELTSAYSGVVEEVLAEPGQTVAVGAPLMKVRASRQQQRNMRMNQGNTDKPVLRRKSVANRLVLPRAGDRPRRFDVGISSVATVHGSRLVTNADLIPPTANMTPEDVVRRTGIETRHWADNGENAVGMAVRASWKTLDTEGLILDDLDLLICATTSPTVVTPSMACQVLNGLGGGKTDALMQAFDINAACSGYLYALQAGYDFLQSTPHGRVLIVTAEVLSPLLDPNDFDTAILFGDAASASILYGEGHFDRSRAKLYRPDLSAKGEDGSVLSVPLLHDGFIQMKGRKVFSEAVRSMVTSLNRVCQREGIHAKDLAHVVPHQANQRIIDAIQSRIGTRVFSNIRHHGNTSSTSIPLCLSEVFPTTTRGDRLGLCAFGGGFTFGASILEMN